MTFPIPIPIPLEIRNQRSGLALHISWDDGLQQCLPHQLLRSKCRCAECTMLRLRSHSDPPVPASVQLTEVRAVGHYAVQLLFSDGHQRGIYPWELLRQLGQTP